MGRRAENRTRACLTASRRTINYATPHPSYSVLGNKLNIISCCQVPGRHPGPSLQDGPQARGEDPRRFQVSGEVTQYSGTVSANAILGYGSMHALMADMMVA